jgi:hypothetical protein
VKGCFALPVVGFDMMIVSTVEVLCREIALESLEIVLGFEFHSKREKFFSNNNYN